MKFSTRKDMEAPIDAIFDKLSNFAAFERAALKRGIEVTRDTPSAGMPGWQIRFPLRGKMRSLSVALDAIDAPEAMSFAGESKSFDLRLDLTLIVLSRARTRLGVELDIRPRTLSGRLLLQSMRLTKPGYTRKFDTAVQSFAERLEKNHFSPHA